MRANAPITQKEFEFSGSETLLSTTDVSSHITYANAAFIRTSGFTAEELIGQPHNLVRHPDMPVEAFLDMWRSLKKGESWTALVKNRRSDGDHYWVRANAAPMRRLGQVVGYLSVRTKPSRKEIVAADAMYRRFREGHADRMEFYRGLVVRKGLLRCLDGQQLLPTAWRVRGPLLLLGIAVWASVVSVSAMPAVAALPLAAAFALTGWYIELQVVAPLRQVLKVAERVASGEPSDLYLNRCDDIGRIARAITQSGLNLRSLMADVQEQVSGVEVASKEIASANSSLASRTEQAASNLEQTAAAMEQQTATVRQNSEAASQANDLAREATLVAARGGDAVDKVVATMELISDSSRRIADIIGVIDGIAFQTNILALNAAVEAARAGEQGRGFAVVAAEVRNLAGRSSSAAREIKSLIDDSVGKVEGGSRVAADAGQTMRELVSHVQRVSDLITAITGASKEQAIGIAQVGQAVDQLDEMTQQNASMVEESSSAANAMSEMAQRLMNAVKVFS